MALSAQRYATGQTRESCGWPAHGIMSGDFWDCALPPTMSVRRQKPRTTRGAASALGKIINADLTTLPTKMDASICQMRSEI
jgi:hypothetical protein